MSDEELLEAEITKLNTTILEKTTTSGTSYMKLDAGQDVDDMDCGHVQANSMCKVYGVSLQWHERYFDLILEGYLMQQQDKSASLGT